MKETQAWAFRLPISNRHELFQLADLPLQVCCDESFIWIRAEKLSETIDQQLAMLPGQRFKPDELGQLFRMGDTLPTAQLPDARWQAIEDVLSWQLPTPALTLLDSQAWRTQPRWELVRSGTEQATAAMIVDLPKLAQWIDTAPLIRIDVLRWVVSPLGHALIIGQPLPNIAGEKFWRCGNVLIPLGFAYQPALPVCELEAALELGESQLAIWQQDNEFSCIDESSLQPMSRASVRMTKTEMST